MTAQRALAATIAAAALAALIAPLDRPGLGWCIASVGVVIAVQVAGRGKAGSTSAASATSAGPAASANLASPVASAAPAGPAAPAAPAALAGPVVSAAPAGPAASAAPAASVGRVDPAGPLGPLGPAALAGPARPAGERWSRRTAGLASLLLIAATAIRDAGWLAALCTVAAVLLASYAVSGGDRAPRVLGGLLGVFAEAPRAAAWLRRGVPAGRGAALRGVLIAVPLVGLLAGLLAAAEPRFAGWLRGGVPSGGRGWLAVLVFLLVAAITGGLVHIRVNGRTERIELPAAIGRPRPTAEWVVPVALVDVLFAAYVLVDLPVLFGGDRYVLRPGGPDYAVYAVDGFVALVVVTLVTLAVVGGVALVARRAGQGDRALIRGLAGPLCGLTLVIAASAVDRMAVYSAAYGWTRLRILGVTAELLLAAFFLLVVGAGVRLKAGWLPRAFVAAAVAALFALVAVNPDALIARTVIDRYERDGHLDFLYLDTLSADATGEVERLPEPDRSCVLAVLAGDDADDPWYAYNVARARLAADIRSRLRSSGC